MAIFSRILEGQEGRWRRLNGYGLVLLVRPELVVNGELVERGAEGRSVIGTDPQRLTIPHIQLHPPIGA